MQEIQPLNNKLETAADNWPTAVLVRDEPGANGQHSEYLVVQCRADGTEIPSAKALARIKFQTGLRPEVNGCTDADLLGIVAHRLSCQTEKYRDDERALVALDSALYWLTRADGAVEPTAALSAH